jgi:hypothetical protein
MPNGEYLVLLQDSTQHRASRTYSPRLHACQVEVEEHLCAVGVQDSSGQTMYSVLIATYESLWNSFLSTGESKTPRTGLINRSSRSQRMSSPSLHCDQGVTYIDEDVVSRLANHLEVLDPRAGALPAICRRSTAITSCRASEFSRVALPYPKERSKNSTTNAAITV